MQIQNQTKQQQGIGLLPVCEQCMYICENMHYALFYMVIGIQVESEAIMSQFKKKQITQKLIRERIFNVILSFYIRFQSLKYKDETMEKIIDSSG